MAMNTTKKVPYFLAAGAIGGAVGYLFFTDSGKRMMNKISDLRVEKSALIPEKIDDFRSFISERGKDVTSVLRNVVDRVKISVSAGQQAFEESGGLYHEEREKLHRTNEE